MCASSSRQPHPHDVFADLLICRLSRSITFTWVRRLDRASGPFAAAFAVPRPLDPRRHTPSRGPRRRRDLLETVERLPTRTARGGGRRHGRGRVAKRDRGGPPTTVKRRVARRGACEEARKGAADTFAYAAAASASAAADAARRSGATTSFGYKKNGRASPRAHNRRVAGAADAVVGVEPSGRERAAGGHRGRAPSRTAAR